MSEQDANNPVVSDLHPLLPLRDVVVFPHMVIPLFVGRAKSIKALENAMEAGKNIVLVAQKSAAKDDPGMEDLYSIGSVANILQMLKLPDGTVKVLVEGTQRTNVLKVYDLNSHFDAEIQIIPAREVSISGGIFLFNFTYWSNCAIKTRRIASDSLPKPSSAGII